MGGDLAKELHRQKLGLLSKTVPVLVCPCSHTSIIILVKAMIVVLSAVPALEEKKIHDSRSDLSELKARGETRADLCDLSGNNFSLSYTNEACELLSARYRRARFGATRSGGQSGCSCCRGGELPWNLDAATKH